MITAVSATELSVGDPITFTGTGFLDESEGWTNVRFVGTFTPNDGSAGTSVDLAVPLRGRRDGTELGWERFGEYRVPFAPDGDKLGVFSGEIRAENVYATRTVPQERQPLQVSLRVLPSLVVIDNRAFGDDFVANCKEPSTVLLELFRYGLRVKALGFTPASFSVTLSDGALQRNLSNDDWVVGEPQQHSFASNGSDEFALTHRWAPVPRYSRGYSASIQVVAQGVGISKFVHFPFVVRPPAAPVLDDREWAELTEPVPVSACMSGGPNGFQVSYTETSAETRSRSATHEITALSAAEGPRCSAPDRCECVGLDELDCDTPRSRNLDNPDVLTVDLTVTEPTAASAGLFDITQAPALVSDLGWQQTDKEPVSSVVTALHRALEIGSLPRGVSGDAWNAREVVGTVALLPGEIRAEWERGSSEQRDAYQRALADRDAPRTYEAQLGWPLADLVEGRGFLRTAVDSEDVDRVFGDQSDSMLLTQSSSDAVDTSPPAWCWAGVTCQWQRQAVRLVNRGPYVVYDLCGAGTSVGETQFSSWVWAMDLAISRDATCPPDSNFSSAACLIPPCVGDRP